MESYCRWGCTCCSMIMIMIHVLKAQFVPASKGSSCPVTSCVQYLLPLACSLQGKMTPQSLMRNNYNEYTA